MIGKPPGPTVRSEAESTPGAIPPIDSCLLQMLLLHWWSLDDSKVSSQYPLC